eukprot:CAMPEP_0202971080 /NCGR_PEP_ID=MMETSP1396-20130829/23254_1 /ASSEMBLY_ACC=CAM_ASM_000872 /TAXON_ID= /ORGANISM="Pseudokeronopsis sp., Strain Brazil" /LENGTH=47 /DNA_ID= /DNA_START= /DNA_END= /DNA_ORIENTATION=
MNRDPNEVEMNFEEHFKKFDKNGNGVICKDEIKTFLMEMAQKLSGKE